MNAPILRIIITASLIVLSLVFGYLLSGTGKPWSAALLGIHKIAALLGGVALVVIVFRFQNAAPLDALRWTFCAVTWLFFLSAFATGAVLTILKNAPAPVLILHKVTPILTVLSSAATFFLLLKR